MVVEKLDLIYFSPTRGTARILEAVAQGLQPAAAPRVRDLTRPGSAAGLEDGARGTFAVIGAPVYAGRLPPLMVARFRELRGEGVPAALVVVYGNRAFEDALVELEDLAGARGFAPVAAAAFIGEHSYSTPLRPIAPGRPDREDLATAREFGSRLRARLGAGGRPPALPGNRPYRVLQRGAAMAPEVDPARCAGCGTCAGICPAGAIPPEAPLRTDPVLCIHCCACVKACPAGARSMTDPHLLGIAETLHRNCSGRKAPELFV